MSTSASLLSLQTPSLLVDEVRMDRNISRLKARLSALNVRFRPHLKTSKCLEIARRLMPSPSGPATVSTLKEAEVFGAAGIRDMLYAVGIAPSKLPRVQALRRSGIDLTIVLDSLEQARAVCAASAEGRIPVLIEIDCDGHRAGVRPDDPRLLEIGRVLLGGGAELRGVMTHAGDSYNHPGAPALVAAANNERNAAAASADALRSAGLPCSVVSVGSTPTAHFAPDLAGITEVRAGVFVFFDLVMAGLGVCKLEDIALSVLATVIGHQREKGWILVDAGWMAMSRDRGTSKQAVDQGYGVVCDVGGVPFPSLVLGDANQEHGVLHLREGATGTLPELTVGSLVRILPNHACATAAQFDRYHVLDSAGSVRVEWPRLKGW